MSTTLVQPTEAVITHHLQALSSKAGIDEVLDDYTESSVILTQNGPVRGLSEVRTLFEAFIAALTPEVLGNFQIMRLDIEGEVAYLLFSAKPLASLGTDTFIVRDGKIEFQTFTVLG